jgi:AcrR family transcriptional regulator
LTAKRIQDAALILFAEKGYDATTLADIAGEIGIKKPSIYAHYASKMDLFSSLVEEAKTDYRECWQQGIVATAHLPADQHLYELFCTVSQYFVADKVKMAFWIRLWMFPPENCPTDIFPSLKKLNKHFVDKIAAIFEEGMEAGLLRQAIPIDSARAYFCLLDGYLMRAICDYDSNYHKILPQIWECFMIGIKAEPVQ